MDSDSFKKATRKLFPQASPPDTLPEDGYGRTEFTYAILRHQTQIALEILKHYDDVNHRDHAGCADLFFAAQSCELEILQELLKKGADPNIETYLGVVPLMADLDAVQAHSHSTTFDAYERAFEMIKSLLEAGADPDKKNKSGGTARQLSKYLAPGPIADYLKALPKQNDGESSV